MSLLAELDCVVGWVPRWFARPKRVTHPGTNQAGRRVTSLIRPTPLPLRHVVTSSPYCQVHGVLLSVVRQEWRWCRHSATPRRPISWCPTPTVVSSNRRLYPGRASDRAAESRELSSSLTTWVVRLVRSVHRVCVFVFA